MSDLVERIKKRLAHGSYNDRAYEKPMSWDDAEALVAEVERLRSDKEQLKSLWHLAETEQGQKLAEYERWSGLASAIADGLMDGFEDTFAAIKDMRDDLQSALTAAHVRGARDEREACALIAEACTTAKPNFGTRTAIAAAIRARGERE